MAKIEITVDNETMEAVKQLTEERNAKIVKRNESRESGEKIERASIASMCGELVTTGAYRRIAANKWAHEHKEPTKARAPKAKKAAAPKAKKAKVVKISKAKAPTVRKAKAAPAPAPAAEAAAAAGSANGSPLD